jgi:hypothetical protein
MKKVEYLSSTLVKIYNGSYYRTRPDGLVPKIVTRHFIFFTRHFLVVRCLCTSLFFALTLSPLVVDAAIGAVAVVTRVTTPTGSGAAGKATPSVTPAQ